MLKAVVAIVQDAGVNSHCFKKPERQAQVLMMKHAFVEGVVPIHRLGPETMYTHYIVNGSDGGHDFKIHFLKKTRGLFKRYHSDPSTHMKFQELRIFPFVGREKRRLTIGTKNSNGAESY